MVNNLLKAYVVAVDMGYGHQRAAFPLLDIATTPKEWNIKEPMIISVNDYPNMPVTDRKRWVDTQKRYEKVSRMNSIPFIGQIIFKIMDYFQSIENFYPRRVLSRPTLQCKRTYKAIKNGFGKHLIDVLNLNPLPLICTFFISAILAEGHGYKGKIYCLCTDTDISRAWVPFNSQDSKIIYLAPTIRVRERLLLYGVKANNIIVTGFPLPVEVIDGVTDQAILRKSLANRIQHLDPDGLYQNKYKPLISSYLKIKPDLIGERPLTITFAVGGAGAQWKIGFDLLKSLRELIISKRIKLNLVAGTSKDILHKFEIAIGSMRLKDFCPDNLNIIYDEDKFNYFRKFDKALISSDILWTKPSELSFYTGLGLPIIMAPTLGSQEMANREWLQLLGAGFDQKDPRYANEWLFDLLKSGSLAQAAMNGFLRVPKDSVTIIKNVVLHNIFSESNNLSL